MPWFVPKAFLTEANTWIHPGIFGVKHKIGRWPHPNTPRANAWFIMRGSKFLAHTAHRRLFCWDMQDTIDPGGFPDWQNFGWYDLVADAPSELSAESDTNIDGWISKEEITYFATLPLAGTEGTEVKMRLEHPASGHFVELIFEHPSDTDQWQWDKSGNPDNRNPDSFTQSVNFPYLTVGNFEWAISDCFRFPRVAPAPLDFAVFNGVDSYIKNRSATLNTNVEWRQEFDIRMHTSGDNLYLAKSFNTTKYCLISIARIVYRGRVTTFTTALNLNQWYHIDFRYEWLSPDGLYRVAVDGGADDTFASTGVVDRWDQFGKRGASTFIGEFDMKNFVLTNGPSSSPVVFLDQKMQADACDDGPDGRHGDTFNMTLPSCP